MSRKYILIVLISLLTTLFFVSFNTIGCKEKGGEVIVETDVEIIEINENKTTEAIEIEKTVEKEISEVMTILVEEVYEIWVNKEDYIILDVRTQEEYDEGHIQGATLINVEELEGRLDELPRDKPIIVYCRSGRRSARAAEILVNNGFREVYDMGGIIDWQEKGYPVAGAGDEIIYGISFSSGQNPFSIYTL